MANEDQDIADSWEEAADSGELDRQLNAALKIHKKPERRRVPETPVVVQEEDMGRTRFTPQIRILKRPSEGDAGGTGRTGGTPNTRAVPPMKPLAQREAEYAEARRRILGSSPPPEVESPPPANRSTPGAAPPARPPPRLQQTQAQVDEVMGIMRVNVERVMDRDEKLSALDSRADALQAGAAQFESSATRLRRKYWWRNCKMWAILIAVFLIIIVIIIVWKYS